MFFRTNFYARELASYSAY